MEEFKQFDEILSADSRWRAFALVNRQTGESRPMQLRDHYDRVSNFDLRKSVPEKIRGQFNTSKNLLVYAWYFYPFFSVAEMHVLGVLELALKTRIGEEGINELKRTKKRIGLHSYIEHARDQRWIRNEDFQAYHQAPYAIARQQYMERKAEEMTALGVNEIALNFDEVEPLAENPVDYVAVLLDTVNFIRNMHAHGDAVLYPASVWQSFEMCSDFVNALFRSVEASR